MRGLGHDLRHGARVLRRDPLYTGAAVLALGLGIGATSALFSVVDAALLSELPFPDPDRLVVVWERNLERGYSFMYASPPNYADWVAETTAFSGPAAFATGRRAIAADGEATAVGGAEVTAGLFDVLGAAPVLGSGFAPSDERDGGPAITLISHDLWQARFGGDPDLVGRTIEVDGEAVEVIGVMQPGFAFPPEIIEDQPARGRTDVWLPLRLGVVAEQRGAHFLTVVGRMRVGTSVEGAAQDVQAVATRLAEAYPGSNQGWTATAVPLHGQLAGQSRSQLGILLGAVALVLLISCVNVANLLLARGGRRTREVAVRAAVGASRARLVRQLLTESVVLGLLGGVAGLVLARAALGTMVALAPETLLRAADAALDLRAVGFTLLISIASALVFGVLPAMSSAAAALAPHLKEGGRGDTGSRARGRLQSWLVGGEVAVSLVLLVAAGLLFQTFLRLTGVDVGVDPERAVTATVALPATRYDDAESRVAAYRELARAVRSHPAIEAAGFIYDIPLSADRQGTSITVRGETEVPEGEDRGVGFSIVSSGYFEAMGIPVLRGRDFGDADTRQGDPVVMVNQALADRFLSDVDPLAQRIGIMGQQRRIVGVVGNVRFQSLRSDPVPVAYMLYDQQAWSGTMSLVAAGTGGQAASADAVRAEIRRFDASVPVYDVATMETVIAASVDRERFSAMLMGSFAGLALLLAAVGIFGVVSHAVARRRKETGIRIALGAASSDVSGMVVRESMRPVVAGLAAGLLGAFVLARLLRGILYGVGAAHPATYIAVALLLLGVSLLAALLPALRAARVDPAIALRSE